MGSYDDIGVPVKGQPISSGAFGIKVRNAILDLDRRVSSVDTSTGTGKAYSGTSLTLTTTTEAAALTVTGMVFKAGLAYEATMRMGLASAIAGCLPNFAVRKYNATPSAGAAWGEYFRFPGPATPSVSTPLSVIGSIFLLNNTSADITSDVNLTVIPNVTGANATILFATTASPRYFVIKPAGFAADYVGMGVQVS